MRSSGTAGDSRVHSFGKRDRGAVANQLLAQDDHAAGEPPARHLHPLAVANALRPLGQQARERGAGLQVPVTKHHLDVPAEREKKDEHHHRVEPDLAGAATINHAASEQTRTHLRPSTGSDEKLPFPDWAR